MKPIFILLLFVLFYPVNLPKLNAQTVARDSVIYAVQDSIYTTVEDMPQFVGGEAELHKYMNKHMRFVEKDLEFPMSEAATFRFVVTKRGEIKDVRMMRGNILRGAKMAKVISEMPIWIPGRYKDKAVDVYFTLPIRVYLKPKRNLYDNPQTYED